MGTPPPGQTIPVLITLPVKNSFLMSNLNFPCCSLRPCFLVHVSSGLMQPPDWHYSSHLLSSRIIPLDPHLPPAVHYMQLLCNADSLQFQHSTWESKSRGAAAGNKQQLWGLLKITWEALQRREQSVFSEGKSWGTAFLLPFQLHPSRPAGQHHGRAEPQRWQRTEVAPAPSDRERSTPTATYTRFTKNSVV